MNADQETIGEYGAPVIARRTLEVTLPDGKMESLEVKLAAPVTSDGSEHRCYWKFSAPGYELVRYAAGADGFQAIQLANRMIGVSLWWFAREKGCQISLDGSTDIGFPDFTT